MPQLFFDNDDNKLFYSVFNEAKKNSQLKQLTMMHQNIIGSVGFGYILFDSGILELDFTVDREFFAQHYVAIFEAMASNGLFESWITLIKALLGDKTDVEFTIPNPGHLVINVKEYSTKPSGLLIDDPDSKGALADRTDGTQDGVLVTKVESSYTIEQAKIVLENLAVAGVFTEFNIVSGS